jgi:tryptophanyl-tRNA synthetase
VTRIVSGVQPTGEMHLGNYLGALRHWTKLQTEAECLYLVADLHALTVAQDPGELRQRILATAALLIAIGIDPLRSVFFVQSHVSEHAELAWILDCVTILGELQRMTQFKHKKCPSRRSRLGGLFV